MYPRNRYRDPHDFTALARREPRLLPYLIRTPDGRVSLDFSSDEAVYLLNRSLLLRDYGLMHWDLPEGHLTPPLPGRLDYLHALHDLLPDARHLLDIGTGASLIYPILGSQEYGWTFVASDIDRRSLKVAEAIVKANGRLRNRVRLRLQPCTERVFAGIVRSVERFDGCICNPPFFASEAEARSATEKKWKKLGRQGSDRSFRGTANELWTRGGEGGFLARMIAESVAFGKQFRYFTCLVSKGSYLKAAEIQLDRAGATDVRRLNIEQGNKRQRILAWTFH